MAKGKLVNLVSAETFEKFSQGDDWESCGGLSLGDPLVTADCDPESWAGVCAVLDVTVVLVAPSSVVTECFWGASWDLDWELVEPQSFFFLQKACLRLDSFAGREEVSMLTSESASAFQKNDAVHATAKPALL